MTRTAIVAIAALLSVSAARAEGLILTPYGWRAAPCCRDQGYPGVQRVPPREFAYGPLAPAFWGAIQREFFPPDQFYYGKPEIMIPSAPPPRYRAAPPPRYAPRAQAPMPIEPMMPEAPAQEEAPPVETLPPPPDLPPGQPDDRFMQFCAANPSAPPCRNRVRGQR
jgi:hypothetical protein